ncbi:hypothetical protein [Acidihalobacter prosperus]|uniref:Uncharacterized protein n=1 Tax=Acidihalobacter prosperus TaxID=160660 RepID=A0A1A6C4F4_9GAMM|nr:hypothetical protein [Acidihalobacter prosperus]OBS09443.1 hypothetical protein Thpro_021771 [Acidihalobacter prosperus]
MDAKTADFNQTSDAGVIDLGAVDAGAGRTIMIMALTVGAIGYLSNIIEMGAHTHMPMWLRAMGAYLPPLGALLGLM